MNILIKFSSLNLSAKNLLEHNIVSTSKNKDTVVEYPNNRKITWRSGRVVDCTCLENRSLGNRTVSSNLTSSAK